jgi:hypothetical protein
VRILVKVIGADPEGKSISLPFKYLQQFENAVSIDVTQVGVSHNMELTATRIAPTMV